MKYQVQVNSNVRQVFETEASSENEAIKDVLSGKAKLKEEVENNKHINARLIPNQSQEAVPVSKG